MAQLPALAQGLPTVEPGNAPDSYQRIQASPAMFGAMTGRALQGAGQDLQQTSNTLFQAQQHFDEVAADDAANQFQAHVGALLHGDPNAQGPDGTTDTGYMGLMGRAALDARPNVQQQIDAYQKQIAGGLKNPRSQKQFNDFALKYKTAVNNQIGSHADGQAKVWYKSVNDSSEKLALQEIAFNNEDPTRVASGASDLMQARIRNAQLIGAQPGDAIWNEAVESSKRDALKTQLEAMAVKQPAKALSILDQPENKKIAGVFYDDLSTKFRTRASEQVGRTAADSAIAGATIAPPKPVVTGEAARAGADAVHAAIVQQESGGRMEVPVSANGAIGPGQMLPATFQKYALPGERIDNPADNLAVSRRLTDDLYRKYDGDPTRVAVAYFSGEGNVAPEGSPTPWKRDTADANGKTVSSYVADVSGRIEGTPAAPQAPQARIASHRADAVNAILKDPELAKDPVARQHALTYVKQYYDAQTVAAEADARAKKEANDQAANGYVQQINTGLVTPDVLKAINNDPSLTWETRRTLYDAAMKTSGSDDVRAYGAGFWKAFQQVTAPPGHRGASMMYRNCSAAPGPVGT